MCSKFFLNVSKIFGQEVKKGLPTMALILMLGTEALEYKHFVDCSSTYSQAISGTVNKFINLPPTGFLSG